MFPKSAIAKGALSRCTALALRRSYADAAAAGTAQLKLTLAAPYNVSRVAAAAR